jgi:hypothetical protein
MSCRCNIFWFFRCVKSDVDVWFREWRKRETTQPFSMTIYREEKEEANCSMSDTMVLVHSELSASF